MTEDRETHPWPLRTRVEWRWGRGRVEGHVREVFTEKVTRVIKGARVTRNATPDTPAYLIEMDDGRQALKSATELFRMF